MKQEVKKQAALKLIRGKAGRTKRLASLDGQGTGTSRGCGYDPFGPVDKQHTRALLDMLKSIPDGRRRPKGSIQDWVWTLRSVTKWLHDTHLDVAMNMLRQRYMLHPEWFRSDRICFLDTWFTRVWLEKFGDFKANQFLPAGSWSYYTGEEPAFCQSNHVWTIDIDDVYAPLHIKGDHWVAMWISLPQRHITLWDSSVKHATDHETAAAVEPICVMLPYLLRECYMGDKSDCSLTPFTHDKPKIGVPQNVVSGDFGVFCIKYMECHALGHEFSAATLRDSNMKHVRDKLAAEAWDETKFAGRTGSTFGQLGVYDN